MAKKKKLILTPYQAQSIYEKIRGIDEFAFDTIIEYLDSSYFDNIPELGELYGKLEEVSNMAGEICRFLMNRAQAGMDKRKRNDSVIQIEL